MPKLPEKSRQQTPLKLGCSVLAKGRDEARFCLPRPGHTREEDERGHGGNPGHVRRTGHIGRFLRATRSGSTTRACIFSCDKRPGHARCFAHARCGGCVRRDRRTGRFPHVSHARRLARGHVAHRPSPIGSRFRSNFLRARLGMACTQSGTSSTPRNAPSTWRTCPAYPMRAN